MAYGERSTATKSAPSQSAEDQRLARYNWNRYCYLRDRGHLRYCERARRLEGFYLGSGGFVELAEGDGQWSLEDAQNLEDEGRKPIEFNEIADAINTPTTTSCGIARPRSPATASFRSAATSISGWSTTTTSPARSASTRSIRWT
jgi:hypothetical protein